MVKKLIIAFIFVSFILPAQEQRTVEIETTLSKNDFFDFSITSIRFNPDELLVNYKEALGTFEPITTDLVIKTNIPTSDASIEHVLRLSSNTLGCTDENNQVISSALTDGLVSLKVGVDQSVFDETSSLQLPFNVDNDGYHGSEQKFILSFGQLPDNAFLCQGEISVLVEFNI
ncbi:hypothetical protein RC083_06795 [Pseudoalteromonas haloplanktis]|uniref:Lipid/polyisoprenoid-binding YceI-like domain-containing protein n=1 Tax=Pseudoalteromonas haloplanktis TaxID=228 RepID=A0ABU1B9U1_PSEHA|nr:hypothetical protein [Pseudoalteromonas haloplanktis]MDQ9091298.1 hypothetical protein [Pseudoalteromonas haloplanktis]